MESLVDGVLVDAKDDCDLGPGQTVPGRQAQQFAVVVAELVEGCVEDAKVAVSVEL
jgi:hypothetical protein